MNKKTLKFILSAALAALAFPSFLFSQEGEAGIKWGGFVKVDMFNDSRAVTAARDDMFMLYPAERKQITSAPSVITDPLAQFIYIYGNNEDLNAVRQTSITAVQTRINVTLNGPDAFGAKTKGFIEADFFGTSNSYTWLFRNRHAYVQLDWGASKLLVGQTWHPLFVAGYHPETVQFSPLVPIHPFNRSPQIRFTQDLGGGLSLNLAAIYRAYHTDTGPSTNSVTTDGMLMARKYKRWADRPDLDIQLLYKSDAFDIGFTVDFNELRPYDSTVAYDDNTTATQIGNNRNKVKGMIWQIFGKFVFDKDNNGHIRFNYFKGENTYHLLMLGGYAEKSNFLLDQRNGIITDITNQDLQNLLLVLPSVTKKEYTPIKVTSYWIQPIWGKDTEYSIIYGKIENNGAKDDVRLTSTIYARGSNIKSVTALIPQVRFKSGKTIIGVMLGYFEAEYMEDDIVLQDLFEKNLGVNTQIYNYTLSTGPTSKRL
ncbi:MAG: hypothetical protein KatS3mg129_1327 [Leptospiraceae bacterium]|nr:MAG: hypothetical protein KatS3mg129_1327 [Leptospiraceae bacterium]